MIISKIHQMYIIHGIKRALNNLLKEEPMKAKANTKKVYLVIRYSSMNRCRVLHVCSNKIGAVDIARGLELKEERTFSAEYGIAIGTYHVLEFKVNDYEPIL